MMFGLWNRYRHVIVGVFLVLIPTIMFSVNVDGERDGNIAAQLYGVSQFASTGLVAGVFDFFDGLYDGEDEEEIDRLRRENRQMVEERSRLIGILQENARLRKLVGIKEDRPELDVVPARVIARDVTPYFNVANVRVTTDAELKPGMAVIGADGVVGTTVNVSGRYAEVRLLTDPRSRIDAVSRRNRTRGIVSGYAENDQLSARLGYVSSEDDVRVGDVLVTSGMAGRFPKELVIGTLVEIESTEKNGSGPTMTLEPATDFGRLEELFIVTETK